MKKLIAKTMMFSILISLGLMFVFWTPIPARAQLQQPTVSIPTVTGTPEGPTIRVNADNDQINVRTGPNTDYDAIGVMIAGETAAALGRSVGGDWIKNCISGSRRRCGLGLFPTGNLTGWIRIGNP